MKEKKHTHFCTETKYTKIEFRCSIKDSMYSDSECRILWDFYVSRSFAAATNTGIELSEYGWNSTQSKTDGLPALENQLARIAGLDSFVIVRSKTIKDTLVKMNLSQEQICITHPRAVMTQAFHIESDEEENIRIVSDESRIHALFRHIRNSFAHGNTYFFPNGMCLLEDKDGKKTTASILITQETLLKWIKGIDKDGKYYKI